MVYLLKLFGVRSPFEKPDLRYKKVLGESRAAQKHLHPEQLALNGFNQAPCAKKGSGV
ncbi:hypothetical protein X474_14935 [Dethiosulfatarculus sandiegensis]|uniref:Uncharacterized protein n=1 Tax=Dethiosulfatarculus sandiegensis TaxID=1429043 RepID=A0A0D2GE48_9BACT|nr:hypothetical protein X474_14935 [Dethiosulfatarculus sandiegensis]